MRMLVPALLTLVALSTAPPEPTAPAPNPLAALEPLLGTWGVPADVFAQRPELAGRVVHDYAWTVGENALCVREGCTGADAETAELQGLVVWHPAEERIELVAVAGHGEGQGRLFQGVYRALDDGRIEREYEVFYRSAADMPGEELGGISRRYREVYAVDGDRLEATLEWWRDGRWQPFGPGRYALERRD